MAAPFDGSEDDAISCEIANKDLRKYLAEILITIVGKPEIQTSFGPYRVDHEISVELDFVVDFFDSC